MATLEVIRNQGIRIFERDTSREPLGNRGNVIEFEEALEVIPTLSLTPGRKFLLAALLNLGSVKMYGEKIGLDYGYFAKNPYDPRITTQVIEEMKREIDGDIDICMAPDDSDIFPGLQLAAALQMPFLRVRKNMPNRNGHDSYQAAIESYTRPGQYDIFSVEKGVLRPYLLGTNGRMGVASDIIDTGEMALLHQYLAELMRSEEHQDARLFVAAALFEKTYTDARQRLAQAQIRPYSGVQIFDLGFNSPKKIDRGWITIPQALDFSFLFNTGQPIPTPSLQAALS